MGVTDLLRRLEFLGREKRKKTCAMKQCNVGLFTYDLTSEWGSENVGAPV